jgi:glucan phosphoethanolaminetransferase (alkaline phosphatase superfamily)
MLGRSRFSSSSKSSAMFIVRLMTNIISFIRPTSLSYLARSQFLQVIFKLFSCGSAIIFSFANTANAFRNDLAAVESTKPASSRRISPLSSVLAYGSMVSLYKITL